MIHFLLYFALQTFSELFMFLFYPNGVTDNLRISHRSNLPSPFKMSRIILFHLKVFSMAYI